MMAAVYIVALTISLLASAFVTGLVLSLLARSNRSPLFDAILGTAVIATAVAIILYLARLLVTTIEIAVAA